MEKLQEAGSQQCMVLTIMLVSVTHSYCFHSPEYFPCPCLRSGASCNKLEEAARRKGAGNHRHVWGLRLTGACVMMCLWQRQFAKPVFLMCHGSDNPFSTVFVVPAHLASYCIVFGLKSRFCTNPTKLQLTPLLLKQWCRRQSRIAQTRVFRLLEEVWSNSEKRGGETMPIQPGCSWRCCFWSNGVEGRAGLLKSRSSESWKKSLKQWWKRGGETTPTQPGCSWRCWAPGREPCTRGS